MILVIRGHIRNSFETQNLFNFIKSLYTIYSDLKIFIHTWNIFANNISWRNVNIDNTIVTEDVIYNYFGEFNKCIKHIIIDDDAKIQLIGNLNGNINNGPMPIIGWKNYWYGKHRIIDYIFNQNVDENEMIINFRFDLLNNSNSFNEDFLIHFIKNNAETQFTKNQFIVNNEVYGIDNVYIGNINTMNKLTNLFFYELDNILNNNGDTIHQEKLVYRINNILFD